jgi:hypothetical protein
VGGIFPLVTNLMFKHLGIPGASSLLGGLVREYQFDDVEVRLNCLIRGHCLH